MSKNITKDFTPLIFEEDVKVSNKTNLKKNDKIVEPLKKKQIGKNVF